MRTELKEKLSTAGTVLAFVISVGVFLYYIPVILDEVGPSYLLLVFGIAIGYLILVVRSHATDRARRAQRVTPTSSVDTQRSGDKTSNHKTTLASEDELLHFARAVTGIHDSVLNCDECRARLPTYVDDEVLNLPIVTLYPGVKRHLDLCTECETEYVEILRLALAEDAGELPTPQDREAVPSQRQLAYFVEVTGLSW